MEQANFALNANDDELTAHALGALLHDCQKHRFPNIPKRNHNPEALWSGSRKSFAILYRGAKLLLGKADYAPYASEIYSQTVQCEDKLAKIANKPPPQRQRVGSILLEASRAETCPESNRFSIAKQAFACVSDFHDPLRTTTNQHAIYTAALTQTVKFALAFANMEEKLDALQQILETTKENDTSAAKTLECAFNKAVDNTDAAQKKNILAMFIERHSMSERYHLTDMATNIHATTSSSKRSRLANWMPSRQPTKLSHS
ncbi:MAG: hypothetical protein ABTQ34_01050 [Bdellovibrionales bacterium]